MNFDNLRLRTKALLPIVALVLVVGAIIIFGATRLIGVSTSASDIIEHRDQGAQLMVRGSRFVIMTGYAVFGVLAYDSDTVEGKFAAASYPTSIERANASFTQAMRLLPDKAATIAKIKERFATIADLSKAPYQIGSDTPGLANGSKLKPQELDKMAQGTKLLANVDIKMHELVDDIVKFNQELSAENAKAAADLRQQSHDALIMMIAVGLIATLVAVSFSIWVSTIKIARPLTRLGDRMAALANGDLAVEIEGHDRRDEIGTMAQAVQVFKDNGIKLRESEVAAAEARAAAEAERQHNEQIRAKAAQEQAIAVERLASGLKRLAGGDLTSRLDDGFSVSYAQIRDDFNEAANKLRETMIAIVSSTGAIRSGTEEISTASDDLSRRTEQQAASLEETAAALDEITVTVKKSAEGASHAKAVVVAANEDAVKSTAVVRQAVDAMQSIAKSSQQVTQIIGVIDEIAFQTNLLALNAGVEAARAGEAGRGFAVVASEVRALAQRSAEAAKEIKGLILTSTAQVDNGVKLVAETGQSLERIMQQVTEINEVITGIAAGAHEQATALAEVNSAINQMDQVTQKNAAMVEESTAASHSLSEETSQLSRLIGQFQVGESNTGDKMRRELRKAAPHVFRRPAAAPARGAQSHLSAVAIADHAPAPAQSNWEEF